MARISRINRIKRSRMARTDRMARIRGFITRETLREPQGSTVNRCLLS